MTHSIAEKRKIKFKGKGKIKRGVKVGIRKVLQHRKEEEHPW